MLNNFLHSYSISGEAAKDTLGRRRQDGEEESHELPNLVTFINKSFAHHYDALIYAGVVSLMMITVAVITYRQRQMIPGKLQNLVEMILEALDNLFFSVMGKEGRKFHSISGDSLSIHLVYES